MMRPRRLSALVTGAGIAICTVADVDMRRPPPVEDGFHVLAADLHVHAAFGDGGLPPWDARREAARRGVDVIAITNHNQLFAARLHRRLFGATRLPIVLAGEEVTAPDYHILAVGIANSIDWRQPAAATIDDIHAQGGIAIAAHPHAATAAGYDAAALARLDAAERVHPGMHRDARTAAAYATFFTRGRQRNPTLAPVGDSDFHFTGAIGLCRSYLLAREVSEAAVLDAIRQGRSVAYDAAGQAYGDPRHITIVERAHRTRPPAAPPPWAARANAAGAVMAWIGLAGLVLLDSGGRAHANGRR